MGEAVEDAGAEGGVAEDLGEMNVVSRALGYGEERSREDAGGRA